jgi:hypothetical protein
MEVMMKWICLSRNVGKFVVEREMLDFAMPFQIFAGTDEDILSMLQIAVTQV